MAFIIIFIPAALRFDIGTDFSEYLFLYKNIDHVYWIEPGFYLINKVLRKMNADPQWIFIITSFIFSAAIFRSYPRKNAWVFHFILIATIWFFSLNGIRQALAIGFCLLAIVRYLDNKLLSFIILTIIGSLFHTSSLVITLVGLIALIPIRYSLKAQILPGIFIVLLAITFLAVTIVLNYLEQILNLIGLAKYSGYFSSSHFKATNIGSGLGSLAKILFSIYIIFNTKLFIAFNKRYWLIILLVFCYAFSTILANNIIVFARMQYVFSMAPIFSGYILYNLKTNQKLNHSILSIFMLFLFFAFIKVSFGTKTTYGDPKLNPYQTYYNKNN